MKKTTRTLLYLILLILLHTPLWAEVSAVIADYSGEVIISRKGEYLDPSDLAPGSKMAPHDILQTGSGGQAELSIISPVSPEISIRIREKTTLHIEHTLNKQNPETSLVLHRGGVDSSITPLVPGASFTIRTHSSVMTVKGTSFSVLTAADGSILVTCLEGKVVCTRGDEDSYVQPGKVFETSPNGQYRIVSVPAGDVETYTRAWLGSRRESIRNQENLSLEHYANLYLQTAPGFLESWSELSSKQSLFNKWEKIIEEGVTMSMGDATKDKITLSNGIIRLRSRLPLMEHIYYTLTDLTEIMSREPPEEKELSDTAERTLLIYHKRQEEFLEKLTQARYYYMIFLEIDKQSSGHSLVPSSDLMEGFLMDDSFFITPPAP